MDKRRLAGLLGLLAVYAFGISTTLPRPTDFDERIFLNVAGHIRESGVPLRTFDVERPMMFFDHTPAIVYLAALLPDMTLLRWLGAIVGFLTLAVVWRVGGGLAGFVGALTVATSPLVLNFAWYLRMEIYVAFAIAIAIALLRSERWLWAGIAAMAGVMFKEVTLGFVLVLAPYVFTRGGWRAAARFALPSVVALALWFGYAAWLSMPDLAYTAGRWFDAAATGAEGARLHGGGLWLLAAALTIGPPLLLMVVGLLRNRDPLAVSLAAYVGVAIGVGMVLSTKEPRWLIAAVPAAALAGSLHAVDLDGERQGILLRVQRRGARS